MNIILLHGMSCRLEDCWKEYIVNLAKELNIQFFAPACPLNEDITLKNWFEDVDKFKNSINTETVFICHSLSTNFIVKYLAKSNLKAKAIISVAGGLASKDRMKYLKDFIFTKKEAQYVVDNIKHRYNIFSNNDNIWTKEEIQNYCYALQTQNIIVDGAGHFGRRSGVKEIPEIKEIIKNIN
ncbi:MAG: alpha/beta hydrolase [Clostridia bacterium]|nr:alpha/beta hydrolase [Clostridia bacterium]